MSAPKWTKGPWQCFAPRSRYIEGPGGVLAHTKAIGDDGSVLPAEDNAVLIAVAPELYEALEDLAMRADGHDMDTLRAYAVLAKARGEG